MATGIPSSLNIPVGIFDLKVENMKSSATETIVDILGPSSRVASFSTMRHAPGIYHWTFAGRPHTISIPPETYFLTFKVHKISRKDSRLKVKGEIDVPIPLLLNGRGVKESKVKLYAEDKETGAYLIVRMDFGLPHVAADPSSRPHVDAGKVPPLPRIVGQIMNSTCGEELKKNLSPDSCRPFWYIANAIWEHLLATHTAQISQCENPGKSGDRTRAALMVAAITYPPTDNIIFDLCEQMRNLLSFLNQCFAGINTDDPEHDAWRKVLVQCCGEIMEEMLKGMLLLFGFSQYYLGGTYKSLAYIANTKPHVRVALTDCKAIQHRLTIIYAKLRSETPPASSCPDEETFVISLLRMALNELKSGGPPRYQPIIASLRGELLQATYTQLLLSFDSISNATERDIHRQYLTQLVQQTREFPLSLRHQQVERLPESVDGGGMAEVFEGTLEHDGKFTKVAMKKINMHPQTSETETQVRQMYLEVLSCSTLHHPNIIQVFGLHRTPTASYILTPWMRHGNLRKCIPGIKQELSARSKSGEAFALVHSVIEDIAQGMCYLHGENIAHGDLRGVNILVDNKQRAVLADFGLAVYTNAHSREFFSMRAGNPRWTAPECLSAEGVLLPSARPTPEADVWSFAHVCIELYTDENPYHTLASNADLMKRILSQSPAPFDGPPSFAVKGLVKAPYIMPSILWDLLLRCWSPAAARPTGDDIVQALRPLTPKRVLDGSRLSSDA